MRRSFSSPAAGRGAELGGARGGGGRGGEGRGRGWSAGLTQQACSTPLQSHRTSCHDHAVPCQVVLYRACKIRSSLIRSGQSLGPPCAAGSAIQVLGTSDVFFLHQAQGHWAGKGFLTFRASPGLVNIGSVCQYLPDSRSRLCSKESACRPNLCQPGWSVRRNMQPRPGSRLSRGVSQKEDAYVHGQGQGAGQADSEYHQRLPGFLLPPTSRVPVSCCRACAPPLLVPLASPSPLASREAEGLAASCIGATVFAQLC